MGGSKQRRWLLHWEYSGEGQGSVLPFVLSEREKTIIERMKEDYLLDDIKTFTFIESIEGD